MRKEYIVTAIEKVRARYIVNANSEEEAREMFEAQEEGFQMIQNDEYEDLDHIVSVEENK